MRPGSPDAAQAITSWFRPGVGSCCTDQVLPSSLEVANRSCVLPVTLPPDCGACSQTVNRLPCVSMDMVGKLAPVTPVGKLETTVFTQLASPTGLVTVWATTSQRFISILFRALLS